MRHLSKVESEFFSAYFPKNVINNTLIYEDKVPFWLSKKMCAVVLGNKIYFRAGHYHSGSLSGIELLAHELTHVAQFFSGMTVWKYIWSTRNGYMESRYEKEAYANAAKIRADYELKLNKSKYEKLAVNLDLMN